jgi:deoxyribodipyrimidine photo-lyase
MVRSEAHRRVDPSRIRILRSGEPATGPVFYWMSRDQRVRDNWALLYAQDIALRFGMPLGVVFCLSPAFLGATARQYGFMLRGLQEVERGLAAKGIRFILLVGDPKKAISAFLKEQSAALMVTDFDPSKIKIAWKRSVTRAVRIPVHEVDTHNIVPCWIASPKQEYGAYTLRPKLRKLLPDYLTEFPGLARHPRKWSSRMKRTDWRKVRRGLKVDETVAEVDWIEPGEAAADRALKRFAVTKLNRYDEDRNDPILDGQSGLSPYLHFGQLSAQRVALTVLQAKSREASREAFLEELITRRELSDNFCFYVPDYDNQKGFPSWARKTLGEHRQDRREHRYSLRELEAARTHDDLWNAAQLEMVTIGKMHGYMRMYWAKKILEWTRSPEEAMRIAIYLNDKYELDGRDPNGYAGIAWSIGGVHDRPWGTRRVFGMIRYMSYNGCRSKFDVDGYIRKVKGLK